MTIQPGNKNVLKIGTRGSPLALTQTNMVISMLRKTFPDLKTETVVIKTSGDWNPEQGEKPLNPDKGGKALFAKEIEEAMLRGDIDAAVHSMKDMDSHLPEGLSIKHMLPRENAGDVFIYKGFAPKQKNLSVLPQGLTVGTSSIRRAAFLKTLRPDFTIVPFRGNVGTRLKKLNTGQVDATLLAAAGLNRLGIRIENSFSVDIDDMCPAAGQGAVGIELRTDDLQTKALFDPISCSKTVLCVTAERAAVKALGGSCHTPIGAYATLDGETLHLRLTLACPESSRIWSETMKTKVETSEDTRNAGHTTGHKLKQKIPDQVLKRITG